MSTSTNTQPAAIPFGILDHIDLKEVIGERKGTIHGTVSLTGPNFGLLKELGFSEENNVEQLRGLVKEHTAMFYVRVFENVSTFQFFDANITAKALNALDHRLLTTFKFDYSVRHAIHVNRDFEYGATFQDVLLIPTDKFEILPALSLAVHYNVLRIAVMEKADVALVKHTLNPTKSRAAVCVVSGPGCFCDVGSFFSKSVDFFFIRARAYNTGQNSCGWEPAKDHHEIHDRLVTHLKTFDPVLLQLMLIPEMRPLLNELFRGKDHS